MRVKKSINNNVLCAIDDKGKEMILTGKGIGFGKKPGERVDETKIQKIYHMEGKSQQRKLRELIESIPLEHVELTQELVSHIKSILPGELNESLLITLADHINFAIKRKEEGIEFQHPLKKEIMSYYPMEYQMGLYCLKEIENQLKVSLNEDEAAFITLHIVNAQLNTKMSMMVDITRMIEGCIDVVELYYKQKFDQDSLDFNRFVVHLRYFASRFFQGELMQDKNDESELMFRNMVIESCKEHYQCAQCIGEYIRNNYQKTISEEEKLYLTIHLKRINMGK